MSFRGAVRAAREGAVDSSHPRVGVLCLEFVACLFVSRLHLRFGVLLQFASHLVEDTVVSSIHINNSNDV